MWFYKGVLLEIKPLLPHLPNALVVLLLEADGPVLRAGVGAVVHAEDDWPGQDHPRRPAAHNGAEQGLAASQG